MSITIPVTELLPGDQFVADGTLFWTAVDKPEQQDNEIVVVVQHRDGGYSRRAWDKGATITVVRA